MIFQEYQIPMKRRPANGTLYFVIYRKNGAVVPNSPVYTHTEHGVLVQDVPFFSQLSEGIDLGCRHCHYYLNISYIYGK